MEFPSRARAYSGRAEHKYAVSAVRAEFWQSRPFAGNRPKTAASSRVTLLQIACFSTDFGRNRIKQQPR
jgi:hypothetical protein